MRTKHQANYRAGLLEAIDIMRNKVPNTEDGTILYMRLTSFRTAITTSYKPYMTDYYIKQVMNRFAQSIISAHETTT